MNFYNKQFQGVKLDPYRILDLYEVNHPAVQHAIKKLLRLGRTHKDQAKDVREAIESLERWEEMQKENQREVVG